MGIDEVTAQFLPSFRVEAGDIIVCQYARTTAVRDVVRACLLKGAAKATGTCAFGPSPACRHPRHLGLRPGEHERTTLQDGCLRFVMPRNGACTLPPVAVEQSAAHTTVTSLEPQLLPVGLTLAQIIRARRTAWSEQGGYRFRFNGEDETFWFAGAADCPRTYPWPLSEPGRTAPTTGWWHDPYCSCDCCQEMEAGGRAEKGQMVPRGPKKADTRRVAVSQRRCLPIRWRLPALAGRDASQSGCAPIRWAEASPGRTHEQGYEIDIRCLRGLTSSISLAPADPRDVGSTWRAEYTFRRDPHRRRPGARPANRLGTS